MPGLNGTGPLGKGPMTGRGFGQYRIAPMTAERMTPPAEEGSSEQSAGIVPQVPVYGRGRGGGPRGCGWGRGFCGRGSRQALVNK